jgi:hydrogenase small subunit
VTKNDCMQIGHNNNTNTCIKAGHPCIGCASKHFPRQIMMHTYDDKRAIIKFKNSYLTGGKA